MCGEGKGGKLKGTGKPAYTVILEYEPVEDAEDRLLRVYELLLGLPEGPEICPEGAEST